MNFFQKYKKAFLVIGFLAAIVLLSWALYSVFFKGESFLNIPGNIATTTPSGSTGLPSSGEGSGATGEGTEGTGTVPSSSSSTGSNQPAYSEGISEIALGGETKVSTITESSAMNPTVASDGTIRYYSQQDGRFYKVNSDGGVSRLSDKIFYQVQGVNWSNSGDKAVIEYPDSSKILYNFSDNSQVTLPSHWEDFSFSTDDGQIVAKSIGLDPENRWLIVSNDDGSNALAIEAIGDNADTVYPSWSPNNQIVAMYTKGIDFNRQEVYFLGLNDENFKSTTVEGRGLETQWSSDGSRLLYSVYNSSNGMKPTLWVVDAEGESISQNRQSLGLETWSSKCTFASDTEVYCAVPQDLPTGAGILPEVADKTKDDIYKIDIDTGAKTLVALPEGDHTVSQIVVSEDGSKLYFTDKQSGGLYSIRLK
jgi:Tol biopolymer transport system component